MTSNTIRLPTFIFTELFAIRRAVHEEHTIMDQDLMAKHFGELRKRFAFLFGFQQAAFTRDNSIHLFPLQSHY